MSCRNDPTAVATRAVGAPRLQEWRMIRWRWRRDALVPRGEKRFGVAFGLMPVVCGLLVGFANPAWGEPEEPAPRLLNSRDILSSWVQDRPIPTERSEPQQSEPEDALTRKLLAEAATALSRGEYEKCQRLLTQAMERSPESSKVRFALGTYYVKRKQYTEAVKVLEALAEDDPRNFRVRNNLAWIYCTAEEESVRDPDKAIRMAQEALLITSDNYHVWSTLSESHYLAGNYQRAMRAAEEAVRLSVEQRAEPVYRQEYLRQYEKCRTALSEQAGTE